MTVIPSFGLLLASVANLLSKMCTWSMRTRSRNQQKCPDNLPKVENVQAKQSIASRHGLDRQSCKALCRPIAVNQVAIRGQVAIECAANNSGQGDKARTHRRGYPMRWSSTHSRMMSGEGIASGSAAIQQPEHRDQTKGTFFVIQDEGGGDTALLQYRQGFSRYRVGRKRHGLHRHDCVSLRIV